MRDRISFSEMKAYREGCQWRWKLDNIDGYRLHIYGIYLDFGTSIHTALEKYKTRKDPISLSDAINLFESKFTALHSANKDKYREKDQELSPALFLSAGRMIIEHLSRCDELNSAEVVYNEHKLEVPIDRDDGLMMNFKGFIDIVIKTKDKRQKTILYIIDFKTCSWGWDGEKRRDIEMHAQLFLYKHFFCKKFNIDPKDVRTAFVLLKRRPPKDACAVEFFPVSAGPVSVQRALDMLNSTVTDMSERLSTGRLVKNRQACVSAFGDTCPYAHTEMCPDD